MKTIILFAVFTVLWTSCTKPEPAISQNEGTMHYSCAIDNNRAYYFAVRDNLSENNDLSWTINGEPISQTGCQVHCHFKSAGTYKIAASRPGAENEPVTLILTVP
jgi:hypothetical protein